MLDTGLSAAIMASRDADLSGESRYEMEVGGVIRRRGKYRNPSWHPVRRPSFESRHERDGMTYRRLVEESHWEVPAVANDNANPILSDPSERMDGSDGGNGHQAIDRRVLRIRSVMERTGLSRAAIYRLIRADDFPAAIRLGPRAVGWPAQRIDEWIASRDTVRSDSAHRGLGRR